MIKRVEFAFIMNCVLSGGIFILSPWFALVFFAIGCIVIFSQYKRSQQRETEALIQYLQALNRGDYRYQLDAYEEGVYSILHAELNKTTTSVKTLNSELIKQKNFLRQSLEDIAHQLKTPITALSILSEQFEDEELSEKTVLQIQRLDNLTRALLKIARLDAKVLPISLKVLEVRDVIARVIREVEPFKGNLEIKLICKRELSILADPNHINEALYNIVHNKIRFAKTEIIIDVFGIGETVQIVISDDGESIDGAVRHHLFERFYSGPQKNPDSIGIGLSLSKALIEVQDGTLNLKKDNSFVVNIPRVTEL